MFILRVSPPPDDPVDVVALALHESDLGCRCRAKGPEREKHIAAYRTAAKDFIAKHKGGII